MTTNDSEEKKENVNFNLAMNKQQLLGIVGSATLFFGVFTPVLSVPMAGNQNYFGGGSRDGLIVLALAIISLVLTMAKKYKALWLTGLCSAGIVLYDLINITVGLSSMKSDLSSGLEGNPFAGIVESMTQAVQIQWGWAILILGAGLLTYCAAKAKLTEAEKKITLIVIAWTLAIGMISTIAFYIYKQSTLVTVDTKVVSLKTITKYNSKYIENPIHDGNNVFEVDVILEGYRSGIKSGQEAYLSYSKSYRDNQLIKGTVTEVGKGILGWGVEVQFQIPDGLSETINQDQYKKVYFPYGTLHGLVVDSSFTLYRDVVSKKIALFKDYLVPGVRELEDAEMDRHTNLPPIDFTPGSDSYKKEIETRVDTSLKYREKIDQLSEEFWAKTPEPEEGVYLLRKNKIKFVPIETEFHSQLPTADSDINAIYEVTSGLRQGDVIVTGPWDVFDKLKDGMKVKVKK